jgi:hypothetical protein
MAIVERPKSGLQDQREPWTFLKLTTTDLQDGGWFLCASALSTIFLALFVADAMLIVLHVFIVKFPHVLSNAFPNVLPKLTFWGRIDRDGSIPERYEAAKMTFGAMVLLAVAYKRARPIFIAPALLILYLAADNLLRFHERFGQLFGIEQEAGELIVMTLFGVGLLAVIVLIASRGTKDNKPALLGIVFSILVFGFFGTGVDTAHAAIDVVAPSLSFTFVLLEEGGELIAQSLVLACCVHAFRTVPPLDRDGYTA